MANAFDGQATAILALLRGDHVDGVTGADITIRNVWRSHGMQIGTGFDENGRAIVFSISLATGRGLARVV